MLKFNFIYDLKQHAEVTKTIEYLMTIVFYVYI